MSTRRFTFRKQTGGQMVINEMQLYKGQLWCAYELKDAHGRYNGGIPTFYANRSQKNNVYLPGLCKEPLMIFVRPYYEPFFKHYDNSECIVRVQRRREGMQPQGESFIICYGQLSKCTIELNKRIGNLTADLYVLRYHLYAVFILDMK